MGTVKSLIRLSLLLEQFASVARVRRRFESGGTPQYQSLVRVLGGFWRTRYTSVRQQYHAKVFTEFRAKLWLNVC